MRCSYAVGARPGQAPITGRRPRGGPSWPPLGRCNELLRAEAWNPVGQQAAVPRKALGDDQPALAIRSPKTPSPGPRAS
eukprot:1777237-Alexandrium_andersonii.AAC.1